MTTIEMTTIAANGLTFRVRRSGTDGEPVIMLHGFPETSHMWQPLMTHLSELGYQCLAPDQRGYCPGARPRGAEHYQYALLTEDVMAMADQLGWDRFHLIGHDHGAGVGWTVTAAHAERIASWSALSVPHIAAFGTAIQEDPDQTERSQYIGFFQEEGAAEQALGADNLAALKQVWDMSSDAQKAAYVSVFEEEYALTGALNWYRGSLSADAMRSTGNRVGDIHTPTILIWGKNDQAIGRRSTELAEQYMKGSYRFIELDAGHWLIQEQCDQVLADITAHVKANPVARG